MANTRRKLLFGLSVSLFVTVVLFATLLAVDVYLHHRHEMNALIEKKIKKSLKEKMRKNHLDYVSSDSSDDDA